ncbi:hypothetical protein HanRHA438_Chr14g0640871 [Helianthus annuus]|nr:hypothetical protein HanRHA438_Chr14g0640871 [Helianthus annuus]
MKASRVNMLNQQFGSFNHIYGETVENQVRRIVKLISQMVSAGITITNSGMNRQLMNSLPKIWDVDVYMIKRTKNRNDVILTKLNAMIKSCEIDNQQSELNHKNSMTTAGLTSSNASLMSQSHPNIVFSLVH